MYEECFAFWNKFFPLLSPLYPKSPYKIPPINKCCGKFVGPQIGILIKLSIV
jgi:hypothetical protein